MVRQNRGLLGGQFSESTGETASTSKSPASISAQPAKRQQVKRHDRNWPTGVWEADELAVAVLVNGACVLRCW